MHDPSITPNHGLNGPTIGGNVPATTPGRCTRYHDRALHARAGSTLSIYYALSTWDPYTLVLMRADFTIAPTAARLGGSAT